MSLPKNRSGRRAVSAALLLCAVSLTARAEDSRPCATCHAAIAETYARTGMGRSFSKPAGLTETRFFHEPSQTWYAIERQGDAWYQRHWRLGFDGRETDALSSRIDWVMGSGNHVKTFLTSTSRGAVYELPLAWYSNNGGQWAMNPGHDLDRALPPRAIAYECMFCHNGYPKIPAGHEEPGREPLYVAPLPEGIDCSRCHGPGANHIRVAGTAGVTRAAIRAAIVNPARLTRDRQLEVCYQCHLETTSLGLPHSTLRTGRHPFSYKPGEPLGDFTLFFDHAPGSPFREDFEIAHSAYRLRKSRCFAESQLTCTTCHNPHDIPRGEQAAQHYNGVCRDCHATLPAAHTSQPDCTGCHMPKRRTMDVIQTVMTDHYIQRRPPPGDLLAPLKERVFDKGYEGDVVLYYPATAPTLEKAMAQVSHRANLRGGIPVLAAEIARLKPARPEAWSALGDALVAAGRPKDAIPALEQALTRAPSSPVITLQLADALHQTRQTARATELLRRAVRTNPNDPLLWYELGLVTSDKTAFEKAVALDPAFADAWNLLGAARADSGDMPGAETAFRTALRHQPDLPEAQSNLAHLLVGLKLFPEAEYYFARSVKLKSPDTDTLVNYAIALAGIGKQQDALERALEATRLTPASGVAHLTAARLFLAQGRTTEARTHLNQATRDPETKDRAEALLRNLP